MLIVSAPGMDGRLLRLETSEKSSASPMIFDY